MHAAQCRGLPPEESWCRTHAQGHRHCTPCSSLPVRSSLCACTRHLCPCTSCSFPCLYHTIHCAMPRSLNVGSKCTKMSLCRRKPDFPTANSLPLATKSRLEEAQASRKAHTLEGACGGDLESLQHTRCCDDSVGGGNSRNDVFDHPLRQLQRHSRNIVPFCPLNCPLIHL